ncbi:hypothetical protein [Lacisediminihabitans changchengi]|uniref:Uncharacterized protein n=1 Tax=Lacisediminihabitans changchengi TaxID=2787634 RepID=A0A934SRI0_9MICO|nr:hypothetical protein [Lacisediminihabitans changchengi]MBK4347645.1 hypothetical protein [Lacisediminihabitans changchengi]
MTADRTVGDRIVVGRAMARSAPIVGHGQIVEGARNVAAGPIALALRGATVADIRAVRHRTTTSIRIR